VASPAGPTSQDRAAHADRGEEDRDARARNEDTIARDGLTVAASEDHVLEVKIGALCWNQYTDWPSLLQAGIRADQLGFDSLWTWVH
jgi:hypothetical protein